MITIILANYVFDTAMPGKYYFQLEIYFRFLSALLLDFEQAEVGINHETIGY